MLRGNLENVVDYTRQVVPLKVVIVALLLQQPSIEHAMAEILFGLFSRSIY